MTEQYTKITLTAAEAGQMELVSGVADVSPETRLLCAQFVAHYMDKGVNTEIHFDGPRTPEHFSAVMDDIIGRACGLAGVS